MGNFFFIFIIFIMIYISNIFCYNSTNLKNVSAEYIATFDKQNGYEGCYALYDSGATSTENCTQFELEYPYKCCKVHYSIGSYSNDYCMPIADNPDAIGDVVDAFENTDEIDIDCYSQMNIFFIKLFFLLFVLLI